MNKKLKLFGLLALTLALAAGVAWAALPDHVLSGNDTNDIKTAVAGANAYNTISGNGTQLGSVKTDDAASPNFLQILQLNADAGNTVTLAPRATGNKVFQESAAARAVQVLVNNGNSGKVVIKASNGDNPAAANRTIYHGGTVQMGGTLGVTNNNALGQRWVGVVGGRTEAGAPVFQVEEVDKLQLGVNDPNNNPTFQPFFLN